MHRFKVTKTIELDYGHKLPNHNSACRNVHGHRAKIEVDVIGDLLPEGSSNSSESMVLDFKEIKQALMEELHARFDHVFIVANTDPLCSFLYRGAAQKDPDLANFKAVLAVDDKFWLREYAVHEFGDVVELSCVPTAENLAWISYELINARLKHAEVLCVRWWETPSSVAQYPA